MAGRKQYLIVSVKRVERAIILVRGRKVLLDINLAEIFGAEMKQLVRAVKRNIDRFPPDFMFQLTNEEFDDLRFHSGASGQCGGVASGGRCCLDFAREPGEDDDRNAAVNQVHQGGSMPEPVDISEEARRHENEWVLFEVTEVDELDRPVKGRLLFHGKTREDLHREAMKVRDRDTYAFFTGPTVPPNKIVVL